MKKAIRKLGLVGEERQPSLAEHIHETIRETIEKMVEEELEAALGAPRYARVEGRAGHRNGTKTRTLTGPTGPAKLTLPRGRIDTPEGTREFSSKILPRYQRRMQEVNEAIAAVYLSGSNTRRLRGALRPLLRGAPLSRSAVSRVVGQLKGDLETWRERSLASLDVVCLYLDAIALKVRSAGKVVSLPVLVGLAVLADGRKQLISLEACSSESHEAWKGFVDGMVARGLRAPRLSIIDGNAGLRRALGEAWPKALVQRCTVHKLRNLHRKVPQHAMGEITEDYHRIVYAKTEDAARKAYKKFASKWGTRCHGAVASLQEAGDELLTFFAFPASQWRALRTTNAIERLNLEFRRRVKTQGSHPDEESALVLLFSLVASGQIVMRRIEGWRDMVHVVSENGTADTAEPEMIAA